MKTVPLSQTDPCFLGFRLSGLQRLSWGGRPIETIPRSWMNLIGFQVVLRDLPADTTETPVKVLVDLWDGEMTKAIDARVPKCCLSGQKARAISGLLRACR